MGKHLTRRQFLRKLFSPLWAVTYFIFGDPARPTAGSFVEYAEYMKTRNVAGTGILGLFQRLTLCICAVTLLIGFPLYTYTGAIGSKRDSDIFLLRVHESVHGVKWVETTAPLYWLQKISELTHSAAIVLGFTLFLTYFILGYRSWKNSRTP